MTKIIVRSEAGVFVGEAEKATYIKELKSGYMTLHNSMNVNHYEGCASLHQLASGKYKSIRLSPMVDTILIKGTYQGISCHYRSVRVWNSTILRKCEITKQSDRCKGD